MMKMALGGEFVEAAMIFEFLNNLQNVVINEILVHYWKKESYSYRDKPRGSYGVMLLVDGNIKFAFEGGELNAKAGDLVFLPKNSRYEAIFEDVSRDYLVNFDADTDLIFSTDPTLLYSNTSLDIFRYFEEYAEENCFGNTMSLKSQAGFYSLFEKIVKNGISLPEVNRSVVEKAKQMLSCTREYSVEEIAKACNISETGLRKKFKEAEGVTLVEYRTRKKIQKAMYLLESTDMSIAEISDELGFYDEAYFCKTFKKSVGVSPKQFIKSKQM